MTSPSLLRDPPPRPLVTHRGIGVVVLGVAVATAAMIVLAVAVTGHETQSPSSHRLVVGAWRLLYDTDAPSVGVMASACVTALLAAFAVAEVEHRVATRSRRSDDIGTSPLAPKVVMADTYGLYAGPVTVTVLIPAHDEASCIETTLASLQAQHDPPERIVVIADNCSDETAHLARACGVEVLETVDNLHKKAGGLNQALSLCLDGQGENDLVMVMDADTVLDQGFLRIARDRMTSDRALMAVGGLFYGEDGCGLMGQFQRNEYIRYSRDVHRRRGRVFVLTGTASLFRPRALRTVAAQRGTLIPGRTGDVYDTAALTEDNELTIALKSLGGLMISPAGCTVVTEVMPSWGALWNQRLRWQRGALENLGAYGITPQTLRYWAQQLGIGYGVVALSGYLALLLVMLVALDTWVWFPFWLSVGMVFVLERLVCVWKGGWRARALAVCLFPELVYASFLNVVYVKGVLDIARRREAGWTHLTRDDQDARAARDRKPA